MKLIDAFQLNTNSRLAVVGAGGKTTAMFRLAHQFGSRVIVSVTTHLAVEQVDMADQYFTLQTPEDLTPLVSSLPDGVTLLIGPEGDIWVYIKSSEKTGFLRYSAAGEEKGFYTVTCDFDILKARIRIFHNKMYFLSSSRGAAQVYTAALPK